MKRAFIFDVDGTLTLSRQRIDPEFEKYFLEFCQRNEVFLVTGSDKPKTLEQVGKDIYDSCSGVYQCNGNELWKKTWLVKKNDWRPPYKIQKYLTNLVYKSKYPVKAGRHIEYRSGMVNFSVVGRNANDLQRKEYFDWDTENGERNKIVKDLNKKHPELTSVIGGMISIDIYPRGADKSQIVRDLNEYDTLHFFGDKIDDKGNDYSLALVITLGKRGTAQQIVDWKDTWSRIKNYE